MQYPTESNHVYDGLSTEELEVQLHRELAALEHAGETEQARLLRRLTVQRIELELHDRTLRESKAELQEARDRCADLFDHAPVGYVILDGKGRIADLNLRAARILGREITELRGRYLGALLEAGENAVLMHHLTRAFRDSDVPVVDEVRARTPRGPICLRLESTVRRARSERGARSRTALVDVTAQRRAERELQEHRHALVQAARMGLLGEIGSALAHELSQPLGALSTYLSVAERRLSAGSREAAELCDLLRKSERQIHRASAVLRRIRRFVRMRPRQTGCYELSTLVGRTLSYLQPDIRRSGVRVRVQGSGARVPGDPYQLEQVFVYLLRNAIDSILEAEAGDGRIEVVLGSHGRGVAEVAVADNGRGLPEAPEQVDAIFDPPWSTRPGAGGLGLSLSRSIVEEHGGRLWAEPNRPRGARFVFTLPLDHGE